MTHNDQHNQDQDGGLHRKFDLMLINKTIFFF